MVGFDVIIEAIRPDVAAPKTADHSEGKFCDQGESRD
jgi:hypothetical protein